MKTKNAMLAEIIEICCDLSYTKGVPEELKPKFLVLGKRLRGSLVNLITADFNEDTPEFQDANKKIEEINTELKKVAKELKDAADAVEQTARLVSVLDNLIGLAVNFV